MSQKDPAGVVTATVYGPRGEVISTQRTGEGQVKFTYDLAGQLSSASDALGNVTGFGYDLSGREVSRTDAAGNMWSTARDVSGAVTATVDPLGRASTTSYDAAGRPAVISDGSGRSRAYFYDDKGRTAGWQAQDAQGNTLDASFGFDAAGRLATEAVGADSRGFSYSPTGEVVAVSDGDGSELGFGYDFAGRRTSVTGVDGFERVWGYDEAGNVASVGTAMVLADRFTGVDGSKPDAGKWTVSGTGKWVIAADHAAGTVTEVKGSSASLVAKTPTAVDQDVALSVARGDRSRATQVAVYARYVNSSNWDRVVVVSNSDTVTVQRDVAGKITTLGTLEAPRGTVRLRVAVSAGRVAAKAWPVDGVEPQGWALDAGGLSAVTGKGAPRVVATGGAGAGNTVGVDDVVLARPGGTTAPIASYSWDPDGRLTAETLPGGVSRKWAYTTGRLTSFTQAGGGTTRASKLTYDPAGRVATEKTGTVTRSFGYDQAGQVVSVTTGGQLVEGFTYTPLGQRATLTKAGATSLYSYDAAGQLLEVDAGTAEVTAFGYDGAGRQTVATDPIGVTTSAVIDPAGRDVGQTRTDGSSTLRTLDASGMPTRIAATSATAVTTVTDLVWAPGGELVSTTDAAGLVTFTRGTPAMAWAARTAGATSTALASDVYRSTLALGSAASEAAAKTYSIYGEPATAPAAAVSLGYRGELHIDGEVFLRARDYNPGLGQFTATDPLAGVNGTAVLGNAYHYANNNPIAFTDPTGMRPDDAGFGDFMGTFMPDDWGDLGRIPLDLLRGVWDGLWDLGSGIVHAAKLVGCALGAPSASTIPDWPVVGYAKDGFDAVCGDDLEALEQVAELALHDPLLLLKEFGKGIVSWDYCAENGGWRCVGHLVPEIVICVLTDCVAEARAILSGGLRDIARLGANDVDDLARLGDEVGEIAKGGISVDEAATLAGTACSFSGDTEVAMADGTRKDISEVEVGDLVAATDPETGETGPRNVAATLPHTDQLLTLHTSTGDIVTTEDHRYWNATDRQWQQAQDLDPATGSTPPTATPSPSKASTGPPSTPTTPTTSPLRTSTPSTSPPASTKSSSTTPAVVWVTLRGCGKSLVSALIPARVHPRWRGLMWAATPSMESVRTVNR